MSAARRELADADRRLLAADAKLALVATVEPDGLPHLTLITSLASKDPSHLMFGQFCEGASKTNLQANPRAGFLALDRSRRWLRGKASWTRCERQGEDYEWFNRKPMFRYNAYFGIHTVHHLDVVEVEEQRTLRPAALLAGAARAHLAAVLASRSADAEALTPLSRRLLAGPSCLKFLSWIGFDGHPVIVPVAATGARAGRRVVIAATGGAGERPPVVPGSHVALFAIDLELRSVLLRGVFHGWRGLGASVLDVDWVYNSMPPKHGQIWPSVPLAPVQFPAR